jgi:hypothetical protein
VGFAQIDGFDAGDMTPLKLGASRLWLVATAGANLGLWCRAQSWKGGIYSREAQTDDHAASLFSRIHREDSFPCVSQTSGFVQR